MSEVDLVRASRDGDHFHYLWAARQCLLLLSQSSDLVAVSIEGPSSRENDSGGIDEGAELIDVGLYFSDEDVVKARRIDFIQLKHSTVQTDKHWTGSGLKKTVNGFAQRYRRLCTMQSEQQLRLKVTFKFVTNRPIALDVLQSIEDLAGGAIPRHADVASLLTGYSGLIGTELSEFFRLFSAEGGESDLWEQRNLLSRDASIYLSDPDYDAVDQLVTLVSRRALSEAKNDPAIRKTDVLRALKVDPSQLFPAPCEVVAPTFELVRTQDAEVLELVLGANAPIVIHADAGVGKSMMARRLACAMPHGSHAVLYDCYGDGLYRNTLNLRHRHRDALVQVANELAACGLCQPVIPSPYSDDKQLMRAFRMRLVQAATILRANNSDAVLCIVVDAADNAGMAAEDFGDRSFVPDLMSMPLPAGVRVVFTCRSHRQGYLHPTSSTVRVLLRPFSPEESAEHLRNSYPEASEHDAAEFELLSSSNPRVQALALALGLTLQEMLTRLGPTPTNVDRTIAELLAGAIGNLRAQAGAVEAEQIDIICNCLSVLRPLIPISVLARVSGTTEEAIRSFAYDLRRPLLVKGDSLHFLDEPSETWFRENFRPDATRLQALLQRLRPLAAESSYAAAVLPQLLLEAGLLDELLELALSDEGLPTNNPIARRDVELQRLSLALKAALAGKRYFAAAKLALRTGGETAAETRQNRLIQENTDIAAHLLSIQRIEEVVSRRTFSSTWMGSANVYFAGLLSGRKELIADGASRLRIGTDWLAAWARQIRNGDNRHEVGDVSDADRAEFALAHLRIYGAKSAADYLRRWTPSSLAFEAGRIATRRLLDQGDETSVDALFEAAGNNVWLLLAIASGSAEVQHRLPAGQLNRLLRLLFSSHVQLEQKESYSAHWKVLSAVVGAIQLALKILPSDSHDWAGILKRYLPARPPYEILPRHEGVAAPLLSAYALHAELTDSPLTIKSLAPEHLRDSINDDGTALNHNADAEAFCRDLRAVLGWFVLEARITCRRVTLGANSISNEELTKLGSAERSRYFQNAALTQSVAVQWLTMLVASEQLQGEPWTRFAVWLEAEKEKLWPTTLISLCRLAAHTRELELFALGTSAYTFRRIEILTGEQAESRVSLYTDLARSVLLLSPEESSAYFDQAFVIAGRIGEENLSRWNALVHLGRAAGDPAVPRSELAYRFSQAAELTESYAEKGFDWRGTVDVLAGLCAPSLFAILSRWRDRRFGDHDYLAPLAVEAVVGLGRLPAKSAVVLGGLDAQWDRMAFLEAALGVEDTKEGKQLVLKASYRYMRLQYQKRSTWERLNELGGQLDLDLLDIQRLSLREEGDDRAGGSSTRTESAYSTPTAEVDASAWKAELDGVQIDDGPALKEAWHRVRLHAKPGRLSDFIEEGMKRAGPRKTAAFVSAMVDWGDLDIFDVNSLLKSIPKALQALAAVRAAMKAAVLDVCKREPHRISRRGRWAFLPLAQLNEDGVVSDEAVVDAMLAGYVDYVDQADAGDLFHILDALATKLTAHEAAEALSYGLTLLQEALVDEKGEGAWSDQLRPPVEVLSALAGYVWTGLGSPTTAERWQFAHVVRNAVELCWDDLLDELMVFAVNGAAEPYCDRRLIFYSWHARQWLLIGLARGARERRKLPDSCIELSRREVNAPHVLIRGFAAQALSDAGAVVDRSELVRLRDINSSKLPETETNSYRGDLQNEPVETGDSDDEKFHFGIDIGPYWFAPLGRAFRLAEQAIERRARKAIVGTMGLHEVAHKEDARYACGVFPKHSWDTHHSHGDSPKVDDLRSYAAYHSMMLVAADLLEKRSTNRGSEEEKNRFAEWLSEQGLTRKSGMWLADLRDPQLTHIPHLQRTSPGSDWYWSVTTDYLDAQLFSDEGGHVLFGDWGFGNNGDAESISVASALTTKALAPALLAALQTATSDRHNLPAASDYEDESTADLPLHTWVNRGNGYAHLDERDPWACGLRYPNMEPSADVARRLGLTASEDGRKWTGRGGGILRSESWTRLVGYGREQTTYPGGRLVADKAFIKELISHSNDHCLVLSVSVRVQVERRGTDDEDFAKYPWPYRRYYLLDQDGITRTL
jgi:hypothetical protein